MQWRRWLSLAGVCLASSCSAPEGVGLHTEGNPDSKGPDEPGPVDEPPACPISVCDGASCATHDEATSCDKPLRLLGPESLATGSFERVVTGTLRCGATYSEHGKCALAGPALTFELDLRDVPGEVELLVEFDAEFDPALRLESESCADPLLLACNRDHSEGVERAVLSQRLTPGLYRLVAGAEELDTSGEFRLLVRARDARARCNRAPPNDTCATAIDLEPRLLVQTVVGSTHCAGDDAYSRWYCSWDHAPDVFYRLDLRGEAEPKLLHATTDLVPTRFDTVLYVLEGSHGGCFDTLACNDDAPHATFSSASEITALLQPGEYFLAVDGSLSTGDFGLRVTLEEPNCLDNDVCGRAMALDPALGSQTAPIDAACAHSTRASPEFEWDSPADVYYRLDLSASGGPMRLVVETDLDDVNFVLFEASGKLECGRELYSDSSWLAVVLDPADYYLMVSPDRSGPQRGELSVELEAVEADELSPCIDEEVAACLQDIEPCCDPWTLRCSLESTWCGLDPARFRCVCDEEPACCSGDVSGADCDAVFDSCGVLCEGVELSSLCEEDS